MTRRALAALALTLVAACGRGQEPVVAPPGTPSPTAPAGGSATAGPAETTPAGDAVVPAQPGNSAPTTMSPADGISADGPPGSFAPALLRAGRGDRIVVEVSAQDGAAPRAATLDHVTSVLASVSQKDVTVVGGGALPDDVEWTAEELRAAAGAAGVTPQGDDAAVLRLLFVHGRFADADNVLGVAVRADTAALFVDEIEGASTPLIGSGTIEVSTTTHEVGHLLGLVDLYLKTGREDPEHPSHSRNRGSVMYWAVESSLVSDLLTGGPPQDFDDDDLADLAQIRQA